MNVTAPSKPAVILAAPINVEESRAKRLQRQQARFRDRGGIFVPANRSTLANILLGKASPLKKPRRSASVSPSRAKPTDNEVSKPALRRSPRKQSQKRIDVVTEGQPPVITDDPELEVSKPIKKASSKSSKSHPQNNSAYKPRKKPSTKKVSEDEFACKPPKKSTKGSAVGKGKCKSLEEHGLAKEDTLSSESTSKAVVASKKERRTNTSIAQDSELQLRRKLINPGTTDIDPSLHKSEAPLVTSKKRRRNPKDAESDVEDGTDKGAKRKKHSSPSESRESPEITVEEDSVKPVGKRSRKVAKSTPKGKKFDNTTTTSYGSSERREFPEINVEEDSVKPIAKRTRKVAKSTRKSKKESSDNSTTTKRKENAPMSKPSKKVASKTGPPKSVLQRIKKSLGTQVVDNEPDPIDFLS